MPRPRILSLPERLDCHDLYAGRGVVMGFVDSGFYPHPDLMRPKRRIRAYADVTRDVPVATDFFEAQPFGWHGTMTACSACGNGYVSGGRYRGLADEAEVVLIKAGEDGRILGKNVASAIRFPLRYPKLGIRVLNVSLGVRRDDPDYADVERAVSEVVAAGVVVFAAAGNTPGAPPLPPGSSADAITVGGQNDRNTRDKDDNSIFPSSYGRARDGAMKPDLIAPAIWLPAPMLPGTLTAREAGPLFQLLSVLEEASAEHGFSESHNASTPEERESVAKLIEAVEARINRGKYLSPDYQHVDGTSFAAPIAASVAAQMLEADPSLSPALIREGLITTAKPILGVPASHQGSGVLQPRLAVEWVLERARR